MYLMSTYHNYHFPLYDFRGIHSRNGVKSPVLVYILPMFCNLIQATHTSIRNLTHAIYLSVQKMNVAKEKTVA